MAQYKWVIPKNGLETAPSEDGLTHVVKTVHWIYKATDGKYFAEVFSAMACATPSETDFTAYPDLTEDQVISWLEAGLDVDALKENLDKQIEDQKNPPIVNLPLPWNK
jgi:hypothetical protein